MGYCGVPSTRWALTGNTGGVLVAESVLGCFTAAAVFAAVWRIRCGWQRGQVF